MQKVSHRWNENGAVAYHERKGNIVEFLSGVNTCVVCSTESLWEGLSKGSLCLSNKGSTCFVKLVKCFWWDVSWSEVVFRMVGGCVTTWLPRILLRKKKKKSHSFVSCHLLRRVSLFNSSQQGTILTVSEVRMEYWHRKRTHFFVRF